MSLLPIHYFGLYWGFLYCTLWIFGQFQISKRSYILSVFVIEFDICPRGFPYQLRYLGILYWCYFFYFLICHKLEKSHPKFPFSDEFLPIVYSHYENTRKMGKNSLLKGNYINVIYIYIRSFQVALVVKNPPGNVEDIETQGWSLGQEESLEEGTRTHFSILAWRIPRTEEPGRLLSTGWQGATWLKQLCMHAYCFLYFDVFSLYDL